MGSAWSGDPEPGPEPKPWKLKAKAVPLLDFHPIKQQTSPNHRVSFVQPHSDGSKGKFWINCSQHMQFCSSRINHSRFWQRARRKTKITPSYQWKDFFNCFVANSRAQQDPSGAAGGKAAPWKGQQLLTHPVSSHPAQEKSSKALLPLCLQQIPPGWVPTHWKAPWAHKQREPYPLLNFQISFFHPVLFWDLSHFALPGCTKSLWWFLFDHGRRGLLVSTCITQGAVSTQLEPWHSKSIEKTVPTYILRSKYYITKKRCMKYIYIYISPICFDF